MKNPGFILISLTHQKLSFYSNNRDDIPYQSYNISSALKGVGQLKGSEKTPLGMHIIRAKIGSKMPENTVFVGRRATGEIFNSTFSKKYPDRDWILSRILWLSGTQLGVNRLGKVDSMQRYIYIHGTPDTEPMGVPKSHGCIRMRNKDIIELFDYVQIGTPVLIES
jgi:hypothetical protein